MKKILITGAGGFIGSFFVEEALSRGYETWAGVRKSTNLQFLTDSRIHFIDFDFEDEIHLKKQLTDCKNKGLRWDYIIHNLGATKCKKYTDFERINALYVKHFSQALTETGMVPERFILMSSLGAWGAGDERCFSPISQANVPNPETYYGRSKLHAENYLKQLPGFPYIIMRPTGVYGPRERDYLLMVKSVKSGIDFSAGYKPQQITFIYVKDLVDAVFQAIDKGVLQRGYFLSDGKAYASSDFSLFIKKALGKRFLLSVKVPLFLLKIICYTVGWVASITGNSSTLNRDKYRIMKQRNWICDITPAQKEFDFSPKYDLEKGVSECIDWYKKNKWI